MKAKKKKKIKRTKEFFTRIQPKNYKFVMKKVKNAGFESAAELVDLMIDKYRVTDRSRKITPIFF